METATSSEAPSPSSPLPAPRPCVARRVFDFLSGFGLATALLLLLGVLTWLATLEQVDHGLHATLRKYFDWRALVVLPEINGKLLPLPLPGGYWVSALLLLNLTLGGMLRARKGWKHVGNLISHAGIILMLVAGGVAHHDSERGNMAISEGAESNAAEDYLEFVVEVAEIQSGKPTRIHEIRGEFLQDLTEGRSRIFRLPKLPFDLELAGYLQHCVPVSPVERAPKQGERVFDGYYLMELPAETQAEKHTAGCYARVLWRDGRAPTPFLLAGASFHGFTVRHQDQVFTVDMRKRTWPMPFTVRLDRFTAEFHPGTMKPSKFVSEITRLERGSEAPFTIRMNEPMRYEGLTFFQASYGPPGAAPGQKLHSVFEVVRNPADKWPEYSLYIVTLGLLITFCLKLVLFISASSRKSRHV